MANYLLNWKQYTYSFSVSKYKLIHQSCKTGDENLFQGQIRESLNSTISTWKAGDSNLTILCSFMGSRFEYHLGIDSPINNCYVFRCTLLQPPWILYGTITAWLPVVHKTYNPISKPLPFPMLARHSNHLQLSHINCNLKATSPTRIPQTTHPPFNSIAKVSLMQVHYKPNLFCPLWMTPQIGGLDHHPLWINICTRGATSPCLGP